MLARQHPRAVPILRIDHDRRIGTDAAKFYRALARTLAAKKLREPVIFVTDLHRPIPQIHPQPARAPTHRTSIEKNREPHDLSPANQNFRCYLN
jgi:hypothetical protein